MFRNGKSLELQPGEFKVEAVLLVLSCEEVGRVLFMHGVDGRRLTK